MPPSTFWAPDPSHFTVPKRRGERAGPAGAVAPGFEADEKERRAATWERRDPEAMRVRREP